MIIQSKHVLEGYGRYVDNLEIKDRTTQEVLGSSSSKITTRMINYWEAEK